MMMTTKEIDIAVGVLATACQLVEKTKKTHLIDYETLQRVERVQRACAGAFYPVVTKYALK